jgi:hypothetical protein
MKEIGLKIRFEYPEGDETKFQKQVPWTDDECVLICLDNCRNMAGMDKKQVERLIQERMELMNPLPKLKPGEYNNKKVKSFNGISDSLLRGALGKSYRKDWTEQQLNEYEEYLKEQQ